MILLCTHRVDSTIITIIERPYKRLKENEFYEFSKYEFLLEFVALLGHVVSSEGIKVDSQKVETVKDRPRPQQ